MKNKEKEEQKQQNEILNKIEDIEDFLNMQIADIEKLSKSIPQEEQNVLTALNIGKIALENARFKLEILKLKLN